MSFSQPNAAARAQIAYEIRQTISELKDRGLLVAAKWASELLNSLPRESRSAPHLPFSPPPQPHAAFHPTSPDPRGHGHGAGRPSLGEFIPSPGPGAFAFDPDGSMSMSMGMGMGMGIAGPSRLRGNSGFGIEKEVEDDILEEDEFQLARCYFDTKEFDRVVHTLKHAQGNRAVFLRIYSSYLSADRKAQESLPHFLDTKEERFSLYPTLTKLILELGDTDDPYLLYLKGILHMRLDHRDEAVTCFVESVKQKPYNWSCWSQMAQLIDATDMFMDLKERLPSSPMLSFAAITVLLDLHTATDLVTSMIKELQVLFPGSTHLKAQMALVYYHLRDFEVAETLFDAVQKADPFRMEEVDIFSNMLYVMDKKAKLGKLAHQYAEIDRNRAEVCCLIGNYFSSRADHTKAITYFKRSLMLNREYLPAWTLMGHEFVELKNSHAAIEAYRKAIDVNAKDYRAWYGLGQAYELLDMPMYAIEYYNRATALRPYDCRMWTALATVYEGLQRLPEAIQAHTRALLGADRIQTPNILGKLAYLHTTMAQGCGESFSSEAVEYHRKLLALGEQDGAPIPDLAGSYIAVAEWEVGAQGEKGDWALAATYLEKVVGTNSPLRDKAEELLRALRLQEAGSTG